MDHKPIAVDREHDLYFSPDDYAETGKGWYFQKFPSQETSQSFKTKQEAMHAYKTKKLKWSE